MRTYIILSLMLVIGLLTPLFSINVSLPEVNTLTSGQTVEIPITVSDVSGSGAISYYADISFTEAVLNCTGVIKTGTLTSSWGAPTVNTSIDGRVTIGAYGTQPLTGQGTLLKIVFTVMGTSGLGSPLNFNVFQFNEGVPSAVTQNGYASVGIPTPPVVPVLNLPANGAINIPVNTTLSWNPATNARYYQLQVATSNTFTSGIVIDQSTITGTSYQVSSLLRGTVYYWRVKSLGVSGNSNWSLARNFTTNLNHLPVSTLPPAISFQEDHIYTQNVQSMLSDADSDPITVTAISSNHIAATMNQFALELTPSLNWNGTEGIRFSIYDGFDTVIDTIAVTVTSVNDAPVLNLPISFTFAEDGSLNINMANYATDVDNATLFITAQNSAHVSVAITDFTATLTASSNWNGAEIIQFTVSDGVLSTTGQTNVIVTPVNDAPSITIPTSFTFSEDSSLVINMVSFVTDVDNPTLTITCQNSTHITASINGLNATLTASANWFGTEALTFTVSDGLLAVIGQTSVTVTSVNDAPQINLPPSVTIVEDGNSILDLTDLVSDVDNTNLTVTAQNSTHVIVVLNGFSATITPNANWFGTETIHFTVSDGSLNTTGQINVIVTPINDAPTINLPTSFTFGEDETLLINMTAFITDIDNANLILTASNNVNVTVIITGLNVTLGNMLNWSGTEQVTFTVNDNMGRAIASDVADIIVTPVNDAPVINGFIPTQTNISALINDTIGFSITASDVDSELSYSWYVNNVNQNITTNEFAYQVLQHTTYVIKAEVSDGISTVQQIWTVSVPVASDDETVSPLDTGLQSNYPNPFNPLTTIRFSLKTSGWVDLSVYDIKGKLIKVLMHRYEISGNYDVPWNGTSSDNQVVSSGVYYVRMKTNQGIDIIKITLIK